MVDLKAERENFDAEVIQSDRAIGGWVSGRTTERNIKGELAGGLLDGVRWCECGEASKAQAGGVEPQCEVIAEMEMEAEPPIDTGRYDTGQCHLMCAVLVESDLDVNRAGVVYGVAVQIA